MTQTRHIPHLCVTFDLCGDEVMKDLRELCEVDVDQLSLQIQTQEREEIALLNFYQLVVSLHIAQPIMIG